ncbi:MAG: hypothetical protein JRN52_02825 [Nitrososphaerota archaeon]|nr:hypothetical protein [Nitrososphaerota archaeon]
MPRRDNEVHRFLATLAYGRVSALELASIRDSGSFDFELLRANETCSLLQCTTDTALSLIKRLGGSYKIAQVCGNTPDELFDWLFLPDTDRFNWTVSGYESPGDAIEQLKSEFFDFLKSKSIRKAKFLEPTISDRSEISEGLISREEMKLADVQTRILKPPGGTSQGFDLVVEGKLDSKPLYACTESASDVSGFERRDFGRSYRDPTITMGPRIARVLVNLAAKQETRTILDPFCGLGTILQEALICGFSVVGSDKSASVVQKAAANLEWLRREYRLSPKLRWRILNRDARRIFPQDLSTIDAVSTEPILLPKFESNPDSLTSSEALTKAASVYEESIFALIPVIRASRGRIAVITPSIMDKRGGVQDLSLAPIIERTKSKLYSPGVTGLRFDYPLRIESGKRRIVNRNVFVFSSAQTPSD